MAGLQNLDESVIEQNLDELVIQKNGNRIDRVSQFQSKLIVHKLAQHRIHDLHVRWELCELITLKVQAGHVKNAFLSEVSKK